MDGSVAQPLSVDTGERGSDLWTLGPRFADIRIIGYGGSSIVLSADDVVTKQKVAVKKLSFTDAISSKRALREIRSLKRLIHENVVKIVDILDASGSSLVPDSSNTVRTSTDESIKTSDLRQICIVEELLDADLHHLIRSNVLTPAYAKLFLYQLLRGLKYIHSANVIHRDMKPSNLLINCHQLTLKISDFGLCRVLDPSYDHSGHLTQRVGTCWYISPEEILTPQSYSSAVDMWAAGCVFAEMLLGRPLFTGANELSQMLLFLDHIHLEEDDWGRVLRFMPNKLLKNHPFRPRTPLGERFTDIDPQALDLLENLLTFDPANRLPASQALRHPYLAEFRQREPKAQVPLSIEYEVEPSSPRGVHALLIEEALGEQTSGSCGYILSPAESNCSSPRDLQSHTTLSSGGGSQSSLCADEPTHETHTLEEILQFYDSGRSQQLAPSSGSICSSSSGSVEDLNARNLRHSQENLHNPIHTAHNIHNLSLTGASQSPQTTPEIEHTEVNTGTSEGRAYRGSNVAAQRFCGEKSGKTTRDIKDDISGTAEGLVNQVQKGQGSRQKHKRKDEDEKDIAEPSLQKIVEDEELKNTIISTELSQNDCEACQSVEITSTVEEHLGVDPYGHIYDQDAHTTVPASNIYTAAQSVNANTSNTHRMQLHANNVSAKTLENNQASQNSTNTRRADVNLSHVHSGARSKHSQPSLPPAGNNSSPNTDYDEEFAKEKKLLEFENQCFYWKFETDSRENEKNNKKRHARGGRHHRGANQTSDLDERYRLPTEHLRFDRDYSNERIRDKRLATVRRQVITMYREELHEINERLREVATFDGAVGGVELLPGDEDTHVLSETTPPVGGGGSIGSTVPHATGNPAPSARNSIIEMLPTSPHSTHTPQPLVTSNFIGTAPTASLGGGSCGQVGGFRSTDCAGDVACEFVPLDGSNGSNREQLDYVNLQRAAVASLPKQQQQQQPQQQSRRNAAADGFSSPEDNPSSPRSSFSSGARPKRSPRKQKAL